MDWKLDFISEDDFVKHVEATIDKYGEKLELFDIKRFNKNIIDPIKLIFDKTVYQSTWEEMVGNEIFRQRDKSNNNDIGYFHQTIFQYMNNCRVPDNGKDVDATISKIGGKYKAVILYHLGSDTLRYNQIDRKSVV